MARLLLIFAFLNCIGLAQNSINGEATVSLIEAGSLCDGALKRVEVHVDISGLQGTGGDAGLNAFSLKILLSNPAFYIRAETGNDPISFDFTSTVASNISAVGGLWLVGSKADTAAPNQSYHVATVFIGNTLGSVTLDLDTSVSSLGSRVIGTSGPGPIDLVFDGALTVTIDSMSSLQLGNAIEAWLTADATFDLQAPFGVVDILDLVAIAECSSL